MEILLYFLVFAVLGIAHEVFWTSLINYFQNKSLKLKGCSSLWMFPIYGCIVFMIIFVRNLYPDSSIFFRGIIYTVLILFWEYITGYTLRKILGKAPWDYSKMKFNINGLIYLGYIPVWYIESLIAELIYLFLRSHIIF